VLASRGSRRWLRRTWFIRREPSRFALALLLAAFLVVAVLHAIKDKMEAVLEAAKQHGVIAHRFYGSDDGGRVLVLDEWPDRQSFESFFREQESQIRPMMQAVGATSEPKASFWNLLATHDEFGWGA